MVQEMWIWISLIVLILLTGLFAMAEMSIFSARRERMKQADEIGDKRGKIVLGFLQHPTEVLTALQLGTTIFSITLGAITDAHFRAPLQAWFESQSVAPGTAGQLAFATVVFVTSVVTIIFAGAIPKKIAWIHADQVAIGSAPLVNFWRIITVPVVSILIKFSDFLSHLIGIRTPSDDDVTETDLKVLVKTGIEAGLVDHKESQIVMNAFELSDRLVREIMTPSELVQSIDLESPWEVVEKRLRGCPRSIFLATRKGEVMGSLKARDMLLAREKFATALHTITSISPDATLLDLFRLFEDRDVRVVVVRDAGEMAGLVTLHDLVAVVLGSLQNIRDAGEHTP
jgi:putative hemolysin